MILHQITTPEQVCFHYPIAGLVSRAMAWCVDQLILTAALVVILFSVMSAGATWGFAVFLLAKLVLDFGYWTWFELRRSGQTPGKRVFKIGVMSASGSRLRFGDVFTRTLVRFVDSPFLIPFFGIVGGTVAIFDPLHRRLGDIAADTIVVAYVTSALPSSVLKQHGRVNTFADNAAIRNRILTRVTRSERDVLFDLMHRRDSLHAETREELFREAADLFRKRYGLPKDVDYLSDEQTVLNLALVIQDTKFVG
ncbi:MAG: RDD family protein [Planctomycetes bacterium]|nr:RDD family protein [Planctomycetota bacterium]